MCLAPVYLASVEINGQLPLKKCTPQIQEVFAGQKVCVQNQNVQKQKTNTTHLESVLQCCCIYCSFIMIFLDLGIPHNVKQNHDLQ